jgi:hypothetical protein
MNSPPNPALSRNPKVDFFRGVALVIIFINHMPLNEWQLYTPSRFGFSDAAEIFVFLSGFVAALAYGCSFENAGLGLGTLRILYRCAQIYTAHLALFFLLATVCVIANQWTTEPDYITRLNIQFFFDRTQEALPALFGLRYVPNMLDILPLYLVILLWVPIVWSWSRLHPGLALGFSLALYACTWLFNWELPADPLSDRSWYFNPFAWQLMFFTGFAFGAGWLRCPGPNRGLVAFCLAFVALAIPLAHEPTLLGVEMFSKLRAALEPLLDKNHLGLLRWLHFLALAYLMVRVFEPKRDWLQWALPRWIAQMGQQSLPLFLLGTMLSYIGGILLDQVGRDGFTTAWINLAGLALLLGAAQVLTWLDGKPWKQVPTAARAPAPMEAIARPVANGFSRAWLQQVWRFAVPMALAAAPLVLLQGKGSNDLVAQSQSEDVIQWQDGI